MNETLGAVLKKYLPGTKRSHICKELGISYPTLSRWVTQPISERTSKQLNTLATLSGSDELKAKIMRL